MTPVAPRRHEPEGGRGTVSFRSLGCKANQEEMECLVSRLVAEGWRVVPFGEPADWVVVNTCTVTGAADSDSRQAVRGAVRVAPAGRVVVTGCLAQRDPAGLAAIPGVSWVVGNAEKADLAAAILTAPRSRTRVTGRDGMPHHAAPRVTVSPDPSRGGFAGYGLAGGAGRRRRATLKIQDGCDEHCTFCVIPSVRGKSRSRPLASALREAATLVASGFREIALTGINTALWGRDLPGAPDLPDLVDALGDVPGLLRVRLNSLEPQYVTPSWLDRFAAAGHVCRHFHLPLQSGDGAVLRRMNRRYGADDYARTLDAILARMPGAAVGCDIMAGFPGESARDFERTHRFLESLPLAYLHVFTYSERPGTPAPRLDDAVPGREKRERSDALRALGTVLRARFAASQVGSRQDVLFEGPSGGGTWQGLSGNYLRVRVPWDTAGEAPEPGRTARRVLLTAVLDDGLMAGFPEGRTA